MILTGTNYNIRSDNLEHQRLHGSGLYNESRAEHFLNLYNRKPVVSKGGGIFGQTSNRGRGDANKILSLMTKVKPIKKGGSFLTPQKKKNTILDVFYWSKAPPWSSALSSPLISSGGGCCDYQFNNCNLLYCFIVRSPDLHPRPEEIRCQHYL